MNSRPAPPNWAAYPLMIFISLALAYLAYRACF